MLLLCLRSRLVTGHWKVLLQSVKKLVLQKNPALAVFLPYSEKGLSAGEEMADSSPSQPL